MQLDTLGQRVEDPGDTERDQTDEYDGDPRETESTIRHERACSEQHRGDRRYGTSIAKLLSAVKGRRRDELLHQYAAVRGDDPL